MSRGYGLWVGVLLGILTVGTGTGSLKPHLIALPGLSSRSGELPYVETNFTIYGMDACYTTCSNGALTTVSVRVWPSALVCVRVSRRKLFLRRSVGDFQVFHVISQ